MTKLCFLYGIYGYYGYYGKFLGLLMWITPRGQSLVPPLARNVKVDRGFNHERTGALLCPAGLDWSNPE